MYIMCVYGTRAVAHYGALCLNVTAKAHQAILISLLPPFHTLEYRTVCIITEKYRQTGKKEGGGGVQQNKSVRKIF